MAKQTFDVCVVGSGPGGGIAAYVLSAAGLKVALVEAGKRLRPGIDYGAHGINAYANLEKRLQAGFKSPIPSVSGDRMPKDHFTPVGDRPGHGQLVALGGRSLCWAGHSLRFGPLDFREWPISYDEVDPYYTKAERLMGVYGAKDGLSNMPDGAFLKEVPLRCGEMLLKRGVERLKKQGRNMEFVGQRKAIPTEPNPAGRAVCHYCGHCMAGCEVDSKYTSANTPIPMGLKTGNLKLFTESTMVRILAKANGPRVEGIEYIDAAGNTNEIRCKALVLSCSTVETARHLLYNRNREFPNGLANHSGQVGKNLCSHFGLTVNGFFPELHGRDISNDDGTDIMHSLLTALYWEKPSTKFSGTYQVQCGSGLRLGGGGWGAANALGFGSKLKKEIREFAACYALMNMQGSLIVSDKKFVDLDPERKDKHGIPLPRVHLHYEDNDIKMAQDMVETCEEIIRTAGGEIYSTPGTVTKDKLQIDYNHWVGTIRMGDDPKKSVVNRWSQTHDIPNLFVGDSSVYTTYAEKNPTLTNVALSWRMSEHLADLFRRGEI